MKINIKADFGDKFYIINDDEQVQLILVGVIILQEGCIKYELSHCGEVYTVFDYECSRDKRVD